MGEGKLLIVEDDLNTSDVLCTYFRARGYEVCATPWGTKVQELCQQHRFDLIILDIRLPDIDGYEVYRRLRSNLRTAYIPIIFLTEKRRREDKIAGLKMGAVDYITKPFDLEELELRVRNALHRAEHGSPLDPVTGLPRGELVDRQLELLLRRERWALLTVAVHHLEGFKEAYGFVARDDALRAIALVLDKTLAELSPDVPVSERFVGHLDESHFIVAVDPEKAEELKEKLATSLKQVISYCYPYEAREEGCIRLQDARGEERYVPLMSVSIGQIDDRMGPFADVEELKRKIAAQLA